MVTKIVNACCLLHNFIRGEVGADVFERLYVDEDEDDEPDVDEELILHIQPSIEWSDFRQKLAQDMWNARPWAGMATNQDVNDEVNGEVNDAGQQRLREYKSWSETHDVVFIDCLLDLVQSREVESGNLKNGGSRSWRSRHRWFKNKYNAIYDVQNGSCSGFGLDESKKMIVADDDVFKDWVKTHPAFSGLNSKAFVYFDQLSRIFEEMINEGVNHRELLDEPETGRGKTTNVAGGNKRSKTDKSSTSHVVAAEIEKMRPLMEKASMNIERMANSFCHEDPLMIRRGSLFKELSNVEGLTQDQVLSAAIILVKDDRIAQLYYQLPTDEKKLHFLLGLIN
ncbi:unnamed protein product [Linum tenue]|uniref:Uncharacterized protein n=1 Tax=Linum tenue TaxID=586396 RepID=A0AAV0J406_9ROSI|nr:unnamed protein product [Linum tenue]